MKADVVLAGVGGQGVLTVAALLAEAAQRDGLDVRQGEVHGMAQRGGAVIATVRMADDPLRGTLVGRGSADVVIGMEPVEALRHLEYLAPSGRLLTAADPVRNVPDYPDVADVLEAIRQIPGAVVVDAAGLAASAGSRRAANVVMVGAASIFLPLRESTLEGCIGEAFAGRGERLVAANLAAFGAGRTVASRAGV
jgi:indolepyruvate ferredoxin oxidoreductase beta subunit